MPTWLKLIGDSKISLTGPPYHGTYEEDHVGFRKVNRPGIHIGDHLFLYDAGGSKRIFALAEATSDPERDPDYDPQKYGSCRWKLNVRYLINLPVESGIHIDEVITNQRNLLKSVQRHSHIEMLPEERQLALQKLQKKNTISGPA